MIQYPFTRNAMPQGPSRAQALCVSLALLAAGLSALIWPQRVMAATAWTVDGRLDEPDWANAKRYADFKTTQPLTLVGPREHTEALLLATPEGLRIGMRATQSADAPAVKPARPRDASSMNGDLLYVMIDPDASGRAAFEFTLSRSGAIRDGIISQENQFSYDWDASWQAAVAETDTGYSGEWMIPWDVLGAGSGAQERELAVHFGRRVESLGERYTDPPVSFEQPRFVSEFMRVSVPAFATKTFQLTPYLSADSNLRDDTTDFRGGADLRWQPVPAWLLAAVLRPDFGQVEADDLVVNFDAIEVFRSDKRPFFTEDQALFESNTPRSDRILYTRRIGGERDGPEGGVADIDAALKLSGKLGAWKLGTLLASEADADGRDFAVLRALRSSDTFDIGQMLTVTERPELDRSARVHLTDVRWKPNGENTVLASAILSDTEQGTLKQSGSGGFINWQYAPNETWKHDLTFTNYGRDLDFNDAGLMFRNNVQQLYANGSYRRTPGGAVQSETWSLTHSQLRSQDGLKLQGFNYLSRTAEMQGGGRHYTELRYDPAGFDDLMSRGNGPVWRNDRLDLWHYWSSPRIGKHQFFLGGWAFQEGQDGYAFQLETEWTVSLSDAWQMRALWYPRWSQDWLIWRDGRAFASYERLQLYQTLDLDWVPSSRHEVRLKAQAIVIDADHGESYVLAPNGRLQADGSPVPDLSVQSFGLQLRYLYRFGPERELYVVYGRGGFESIEDSEPRHSTRLLRDALELRDSDQFLVKLRWGF